MQIRKLLIPFLIAIVSIGIFSYFLYQHQQRCPVCFSLKLFTLDVVRHYLSSFGPWSFVVYVFFYMINTISLLPPIAIMTLSAAVLFGPVKGFLAVMLGAFLGTSATFLISRYFGGKIVESILKNPKAKEIQEKLNQNGFIIILPIRLIGFPPWELVNYTCGLSKVTYRDYILATMIGIIPATAIQVVFVDRLSNFDYRDPTLYIAVGAFVLLAVVPTMVLKARKKKEI